MGSFLPIFKVINKGDLVFSGGSENQLSPLLKSDNFMISLFPYEEHLKDFFSFKVFMVKVDSHKIIGKGNMLLNRKYDQ